jgi:hypothetical protein
MYNHQTIVYFSLISPNNTRTSRYRFQIQA